jgi:hypothetical protein
MKSTSALQNTPQNILEDLLLRRARLVQSLGATTRTVRFEDGEVERFAPSELLEAIAALDQQIAAMSGQQERRPFTVASSSGLPGGNWCSGSGDVRDDRDQP